MTVALSFVPPQFEDEYDGLKMRTLVEELERLHAEVSRGFDNIDTTSSEINDLGTAVIWANVPNANITEASVVQHEAALTIAEAKITDGSLLARVGSTEVITQVWDFTTNPKIDAAGIDTGIFAEARVAAHTGEVTGLTALLLDITAITGQDALTSGLVGTDELLLNDEGTPAGDPDFTSVVLLLDWAGVDEATSTTDLSNSAHSATFEGNAQIDTAIQSPEGTNSALFDGDNDSVVFPDSNDWDFGTGDFTVECSVRFATLAGTQTMFGHSGGGADAGFRLSFVDPNILWLIGATTIASRALSPVVDTYHHIAVSRTGTDLRIFFDGVQSGATITDSTAIGPTARDLDLGSAVGTVQELNGLLGAVRITKGVGRYTANFTPPSVFYPVAPFVASALKHMDVSVLEAYLTILETQITNGALLARVGDPETITDAWIFTKTGTANAAISIEADTPVFRMKENDAAADEKIWDMEALGGDLVFRTRSDDLSTFGTWMVVERTGVTVNKVIFDGQAVEVDGTLSAGATTITGALLATTYGGITESDLLDKSAAETILGAWDFAALVEIVSGNTFRIKDTTGADSASFSHDGTDFITAFVNTADWEISLLTGNVWLRDGVGLKISDATDADFVIQSHDGTDFNFAFTQTTDWNITGITAIKAGTVDADFDAITATSYGAIVESDLLDKSAAETILGAWDFAALVEIVSGNTFRIKDATGADSASFSHDGTDFITAFVNTVNWEISLLTGNVWIRDGAGLKISDATDGDFVIQSHDGTDFNFAFTNTTDWNITGVDLLIGGAARITSAGAITAVSFGGIASANLLDKNAAELILGAWDFAALVEIISGNTLRIKDSTNADSMQFRHDGTDALTDFVQTGDWLIAGLTGVVKIDGVQVATLNTNWAAADITSGEFAAARVRRMTVKDTRAVDDAPDAFNNEVLFDFKTRTTLTPDPPGTDTFVGLMTFAPWGDASGGPNYQLVFSNTSNVPHLAVRLGDHGASGSDWGAWSELWSSTSRQIKSNAYGTAALPTFVSNSADSDSGWYGESSNVLAASTVGVRRLQLYANWALFAPPIRTIGANTVPASGSSLSTDMLHLDAKEALDGNDSWLRLNQANAFSSGVYTPYNVRIDGTLKRQGGNFAYAGWNTTGQTSGMMTISTSAASGGANGDIHFRY